MLVMRTNSFVECQDEPHTAQRSTTSLATRKNAQPEHCSSESSISRIGSGPGLGYRHTCVALRRRYGFSRCEAPNRERPSQEDLLGKNQPMSSCDQTRYPVIAALVSIPETEP